METETKVPPAVAVTQEGPDWFRLRTGNMSMLVTGGDLQAIAQAAYDDHGILAVPSIAREAEAYAARHPGMCRCGMPGCSDGDTALREFADRWGQSLRGRA